MGFKMKGFPMHNSASALKQKEASPMKLVDKIIDGEVVDDAAWDKKKKEILAAKENLTQANFNINHPTQGGQAPIDAATKDYLVAAGVYDESLPDKGLSKIDEENLSKYLGTESMQLTGKDLNQHLDAMIQLEKNKRQAAYDDPSNTSTNYKPKVELEGKALDEWLAKGGLSEEQIEGYKNRHNAMEGE